MGLRLTQANAADTLTGAELVRLTQLSTTVTYTATTISAQGSDNSFNDSANGLVAAGFAENKSVMVTGFTGNVVNNLYVGIIETLTAGKMIMKSPEGDDIVDEAEGDSITITQWDTARITLSDLLAKLWTSLALVGDLTPSQITSNQNDYAPTGLSSASVLRLSTDASRNITGLQGGADGRVLILHNVGSFSLVLKDESASSSAANRFALSADVTLTADQSTLIQYDSTSSRWRVIGGVGSGGGSGTIGGSTGSTDNAVVRADGTGGSTVQSTGVIIDDNNALYGQYAKVETQTGTTYTFVAADNGKIIRFSNASAITVTLPNSLSEGWNCLAVQAGAGQVTFSAASGATLTNRSGHTKSAGQYAQLPLFVSGNSGGSAAIYNLGGDTTT